jgi:predicted phage baseplate assembly protein
MPIRPPALDDRSFDDLVDDLLARIPAHTPEWTNPRLGDPGRTLVELFAWLTDTLLYRANLIPERQRLEFLRLLGLQMRPAVAARGLVSIVLDEDTAFPVSLQPFATVKGPVAFETRSELTVLPVTAEAYHKRSLTEREAGDLADVVDGLRQVYRLDDRPVPYVTTALFPGGAASAEGFDVVQSAVDGSLWLALLAAKPELVDAVKETLGGTAEARQQLLSVGVAPSIKVPALFEDIGPRARIPHVWEMSTGREISGEPEYLTLEPLDGTEGLTRRGVVRLVLPRADDIGAPSNDVHLVPDAGVGDRPPRLDDPDKAARLVAWLRLRPTITLETLRLSWVGINAVEIDQRQSIAGRVVGQSTGAADQQVQLPGTGIDSETLVLQVEETDRGYQPWQLVDDLATMGRDASAFTLDSEAGTVRFGDGVRGRIPESGRRIRVGFMRAGGGLGGNLPPGLLTDISARQIDGQNVTRKLKVLQPMATDGGDDAETLDEAERRIPAVFRHRDRAVTEDDFRALAVEAPGVRVGRVEVLARFKPQQRRSGVPGVVSVMVLPFKTTLTPPNPRPDRPFLETVHGHLDARRPLATELYTIGCEYVPLGVSLGITIRDGFGRDTVITAVREAVRRFLWPLAPGGAALTGWPLGRPVRDREIEVAVAQVSGVSGVLGINLFERQADQWMLVEPPLTLHTKTLPVDPGTLTRPGLVSQVELPLSPWQLPELLSVVVVADSEPPGTLRGVPTAFPGGIAIPVVPDKC